jgi:metal-sulfur cluster biosynthetic enzyme
MNEDNSSSNETFQLPSHLPFWQIQETHPHLITSIYNALKEIYDPEIRLSVIDLGLIRDIQIGKVKQM